MGSSLKNRISLGFYFLCLNKKISNTAIKLCIYDQEHCLCYSKLLKQEYEINGKSKSLYMLCEVSIKNNNLPFSGNMLQYINDGL